MITGSSFERTSWGRFIAVLALTWGGTIALILLLSPATGQRLAVIAAFVAALPGLFGSLDELARWLGHAQLGVVVLVRPAQLDVATPARAHPPNGPAAAEIAARSIRAW